MKIERIISVLIIVIMTMNILMTISFANDNELKVDIYYEYDSSQNVMVVHATSNRELKQKTLPGWVLGADKKSYTAIYDANQTFSTYFTDAVTGIKVEKEIVINQIKNIAPQIEITYEYDRNNDVVVVHAKSDRELVQKTLAGWVLGADKKSYTATYYTNQRFSTYFTDAATGNKTEKEIVINQIQYLAPKIEITYDYDKNKNVVTVHAKSNRELKQKTLPGWVLGADRKSYTATYSTNQRFSTYFTDAITGIKAEKEIVIDQIGNIKPQIEITYEYDRNNDIVIVHAKSDRELVQKTLPGWVLGADKKSYTATYYINQRFSTYFTDAVTGSKTEKEIVINQIQYLEPKIEITYDYDKNKNVVTVHAKSNRELVQKTLPGWVLGADRKSYTATYSTNQRFSTYFTDAITGIKAEKEIVIDQIGNIAPQIEITYEYDSSRNVVIVHAKSNRELVQKTLPGWILGADKKSYTATYDMNQQFSTYFTDAATGIKVEKNIIISQVQGIEPQIKITYEYDANRNVVIVHAKSDRELKQKTLPGWILGADKKSYTATYDKNQVFTTNFTDYKTGKKAEREIRIDQIMEIAISYTYNQDKTVVTVHAKSNKELKPKTLAGWVLGADKKSFTATYSDPQTFNTYFTDAYTGCKLERNIRISISNVSKIDETAYRGYKSALEQLQRKFPNWVIVVQETGLDWNNVINQEDQFLGGSPKNLIQWPYLNQWKVGTQTYDVSGNWYRASRSAIEYMMDPRNSMEEAWIFQFQDLSSSTGTREEIERMTQGTFLHTNSAIDTIISTAQENGISPFHIVSRIIQEQSANGSGLMNGYDYLGRRVYNLFNINVSGNTSAGILAGARYAYDRGWFSVEDSIRGGAEFLKKNYISKGQSTLYFQKYNVVAAPLYEHQYMQNIRAANDEGNKIYNSYKNNGILNSHFEFVIPLYRNMPSSPCPRPAQ